MGATTAKGFLAAGNLFSAEKVIIHLSKHSIKQKMMQQYSYSTSEDDPDLSEVCLVGGDLTEFNVRRVGTGIRKLDLSYNMLYKLKGLESSADTLEEIILDNNQLHRIEFRENFPKLHTLSLNKNMVSDLPTVVSSIQRFAPELRHLSLLGNPACPDQLTTDDVNESDYQLYRHFVVHHLTQLRFLDHRPVTQMELFESKGSQHREINFYQMSSPLPPVKWQPNAKFGVGGHPAKGKQGKRKYKYIGKNSEGNRFIKDTDL